MENKLAQFIVVDDDPTSVELIKMAISNSFDSHVVYDFTEPDKALYHILENYNKPGEYKSVMLFLDLNMPLFNGWSFIDLFSLLDEKIKNQINICIVSSSEDPQDKIRSTQNIYVSEYIDKKVLFVDLQFVLAKYKMVA